MFSLGYVFDGVGGGDGDDEIRSLALVFAFSIAVALIFGSVVGVRRFGFLLVGGSDSSVSVNLD